MSKLRSKDERRGRMTREEAIKILKSKMDGSVDTSYEWAEAVRMAIEALSAEALPAVRNVKTTTELWNIWNIYYGKGGTE